MKKIVLFSLAFALVFFSCVNKHAYTLDGEFANEDYNGKTVYLQKLDPENYGMIILDSAQVENGRFQFNGIAPDTLQLRFIGVDDDNVMPAMFVLEPGKIAISFDSSESPVIKGTPLNEEYQAFTNEINKMFDESNKKYQEVQEAIENDPSGKVMEEFSEYRDIFMTKFKEKIFSFVRPNMSNSLGEYMFVNYSFYLDSKQIVDLLAIASPEFRSKEDIQNVEKRAVAKDATTTGKPFVDIKGKNPEGQDVALSDYAGKGKVVLVDFWASWCGPCIRSLPEVVQLYKKYKDKGFEIVGVSLDEDKEAWINATQKHQVTWPQLSNLQGWEDEAAMTYGVAAIPHTVLIDKKGIIREKDISPEMLDSKIEGLLK